MRLLGKVAVGVAAWEAMQAALRFQARKLLFAQAQARATELGRKLVVVGDPDSGAHTQLARAYGCGDLCVDLNGCPKCSNALKLDITKGRIPVSDNSAVIFVGCVLEYVDDVKAAWLEMRRAAGQNLFVATVGGWSLTTHLFPGAKWSLTPRGGGFLATRISDDPRDGSTLLGLN